MAKGVLLMFRKIVIVLTVTGVFSGGLTANAVALAAHIRVGMASATGARTLSSRHPRAISIRHVSSAANVDTTRGGTGAPTTAP